MNVDIEKTIADYDALVDRALAIINTPWRWQSCSEADYPSLSILDGIATLEWYDRNYSGGRESFDFPAHLLTTSDEELTDWKANENRLYEKRKRLERAQMFQNTQAQEFATYVKLKAKYGQFYP